MKLLFNPFYKVAGWKAVLIGLVFVCATTVIGYFSGTVFFGIEVKFVNSPELGYAFALQGIGIGCYVVFMYLLSLILAKGVRFQDILGTVLLARYPLIFAAIPGFFFSLPDIGLSTNPESLDISALVPYIAPMLIAGIFIMLFIIWSLVVLFHGFKTSTGLKGARCGIGYALSVILSEIATLFIVFNIS